MAIPKATTGVLKKLYEEMHSCTKCFGEPTCKIAEDPKKVIRTVNKRSVTSALFLIGQALGEHTQRLSGMPYAKPDGSLSLTGHDLSKFLHAFGYTIDPPSNQYQYAYSSDIVQCFPGKKETGRGDRKPNDHEIRNCMDQGYLVKEIELIRPKLILLMGKASRDTFYKYMLKESHPDSLSIHTQVIIERKEIPQFSLGSLDTYVLPIQHPSGANRRFSAFANNEQLLELIRGVLE